MTNSTTTKAINVTGPIVTVASNNTGDILCIVAGRVGYYNENDCPKIDGKIVNMYEGVININGKHIFTGRMIKQIFDFRLIPYYGCEFRFNEIDLVIVDDNEEQIEENVVEEGEEKMNVNGFSAEEVEETLTKEQLELRKEYIGMFEEEDMTVSEIAEWKGVKESTVYFLIRDKVNIDIEFSEEIENELGLLLEEAEIELNKKPSINKKRRRIVNLNAKRSIKFVGKNIKDDVGNVEIGINRFSDQYIKSCNNPDCSTNIAKKKADAIWDDLYCKGFIGIKPASIFRVYGMYFNSPDWPDYDMYGRRIVKTSRFNKWDLYPVQAADIKNRFGEVTRKASNVFISAITGRTEVLNRKPDGMIGSDFRFGGLLGRTTKKRFDEMSDNAYMINIQRENIMKTLRTKTEAKYGKTFIAKYESLSDEIKANVSLEEYMSSAIDAKINGYAEIDSYIDSKLKPITCNAFEYYGYNSSRDMWNDIRNKLASSVNNKIDEYYELLKETKIYDAAEVKHDSVTYIAGSDGKVSKKVTAMGWSGSLSKVKVSSRVNGIVQINKDGSAKSKTITFDNAMKKDLYEVAHATMNGEITKELSWSAAMDKESEADHSYVYFCPCCGSSDINLLGKTPNEFTMSGGVYTSEYNNTNKSHEVAFAGSDCEDYYRIHEIDPKTGEEHDYTFINGVLLEDDYISSESVKATVSLDKPIGEEGESTVIDTISDDDIDYESISSDMLLSDEYDRRMKRYRFEDKRSKLSRYITPMVHYADGEIATANGWIRLRDSKPRIDSNRIGDKEYYAEHMSTLNKNVADIDKYGEMLIRVFSSLRSNTYMIPETYNEELATFNDNKPNLELVELPENNVFDGVDYTTPYNCANWCDINDDVIYTTNMANMYDGGAPLGLFNRK